MNEPNLLWSAIARIVALFLGGLVLLIAAFGSLFGLIGIITSSDWLSRTFHISPPISFFFTVIIIIASIIYSLNHKYYYRERMVRKLFPIQNVAELSEEVRKFITHDIKAREFINMDEFNVEHPYFDRDDLYLVQVLLSRTEYRWLVDKELDQLNELYSKSQQRRPRYYLDFLRK